MLQDAALPWFFATRTCVQSVRVIKSFVVLTFDENFAGSPRTAERWQSALAMCEDTAMDGADGREWLGRRRSAGRPAQSITGESRWVVVRFRVTAEEEERLGQDARKAGYKTRSQYIRAKLGLTSRPA